MSEFSSNQVPWLLVLFRLIHDYYWHWMINFLCVGLKQCKQLCLTCPKDKTVAGCMDCVIYG